ncbi:uncharacterized protein Dsimw501_GD10534, partial [Drosophila simulans]
SFSNLKEMSQQFPIQPIVLRPHPQLPQSLALNGASGGPPLHHPAYAAAYSVECVPGGHGPPHPPPKLRINSPEKLNSTAVAAAASGGGGGGTQHHEPTTTGYHHSGQLMLHRPFSTSPELKHSAPEIT